MGRHIEFGIGAAKSANEENMGHDAARMALSYLKQFDPSLALVFVPTDLDIPAVVRGIRQVVGGCPLIGTSAAAEIADRLINGSVVVALIGSPHIKAHVGLGEAVSSDYRLAVDKALIRAGVEKYFDAKQPLHQMLHISAAGKLGVSPALIMAFTPGTTVSHYSLSHEIHSLLRRYTNNRIPIFGGCSADYPQFTHNYQIVDDRVVEDGIAFAFIETDMLFGIGLAHGFSPTTKRALITRAEGKTVMTLDNRPAAEVYAEFMGMRIDTLATKLENSPFLFQGSPFGSIDFYGNSILHVPERVLPDGSILLASQMRNDQVLTLMRSTPEDIISAGWTAYRKAVRNGGLANPEFALMFSCALRLANGFGEEEIDYLRQRINLPIGGFYTQGEKGIFDDGLPVFSNFSISTLVFSDELNPIASLINRNKQIYNQFNRRINRKAYQLKAINRLSKRIDDAKSLEELIGDLDDVLPSLLPWAYSAIFMVDPQTATHVLASPTALADFPETIDPEAPSEEHIYLRLENQGKHFGCLVLKKKHAETEPNEDGVMLAETVAKMIANGFHRLAIDSQMIVRMRQLDILNQIGHILSRPVSFGEQAQEILKHIIGVFKLTFATLWLVDATHRLLVKEAMDCSDAFAIDELASENDERLASWQFQHQQLIFHKSTDRKCQMVDLHQPFPYTFVSLPIFSKNELRGILNLYSSDAYRWASEQEGVLENIDFLWTVSHQVAIFVENRTYHQDRMYFKEIHHRVKNNLQNIASLLRMQRRRVNHQAAKQALSDSISRIMSIAQVHETLSLRSVGMVELGELIGSISKIPEAGGGRRPMITLDVSGPEILMSSKAATPLALVVNELVQNAFEHGVRPQGNGRIAINVESEAERILVSVSDDGPGLPDGFDFEQQGHLGLTIVRTLVKDELMGSFEMINDNGTTALVSFPSPMNHKPIAEEEL